jgi:hypothetical protein
VQFQRQWSQKITNLDGTKIARILMRYHSGSIFDKMGQSGPDQTGKEDGNDINQKVRSVELDNLISSFLDSPHRRYHLARGGGEATNTVIKQYSTAYNYMGNRNRKIHLGVEAKCDDCGMRIVVVRPTSSKGIDRGVLHAFTLRFTRHPAAREAPAKCSTVRRAQAQGISISLAVGGEEDRNIS